MNNGATAIKKTYLAMHVACLSNAHFVHSFVQEVKVPSRARACALPSLFCVLVLSGVVVTKTPTLDSILPPLKCSFE
jgi:hypothetical protein